MTDTTRHDGPARAAEAQPSRQGDRQTYRAAHGVLAPADLDALGYASVCDVALARNALGGPCIDHLTDLPAEVGRDLPTAADGLDHVGRHGGGGSTAESDADTSDESLSSFIERRLRDAEFLVLPNRSAGYRFVKRSMDLVGATLLLILTAPLMAILAVLIRLDSPGPALFRQRRVTSGGREFRFYKFRTMYSDAHDRFPDLYDYRAADRAFGSAYYKLADDPRNTRVGRWLRRTTLDELPNLFNVFAGDLSLVGPRPDLPELVRRYQPEELSCLFTKAGMTGLAQVAGRSLLTVGQRLTLDTRYVANQSVLLDLRIMVRTVIVVITGRGAI